MQRSAEEAAEALREVCMVLDAIALDRSFARHAKREPLRLASDRIENVARTLIGEAHASGPIGAKHTSIVGKVALAAATISVLPFAEDAGQMLMHRFTASHGRAMTNLDWVYRFAECAQSERRNALRDQIAALSAELDCLAAGVGTETSDQRGALQHALERRELPARWTLEHLEQVLAKASCKQPRGSVSEDERRFVGSTDERLDRLAEIEFTIAEIFAQLTGDDPMSV